MDTIIFKTVFGSQLYGTNTPESDSDYKAVGLPSAEQIILGTSPSTTNESSNTTQFRKNTKDDFDFEIFSLSKYLELGHQGQTIFYDMLFAPQKFWIESTPIWEELVANKDQIINKKCGAALGYARAQAERYSARGERLVALEEVVKFLKLCTNPKYTELGESLDIHNIKNYVSEASLQYIKYPEELAPHLPEGKIKYLEVCGKKAGFTSSVKFALDVFSNILGQYGDRAKAASIDGVDWKAMYHALRISYQTQELLQTGHITFPRPEKELLLQVRKGQLSYEYVSELIEDGLKKVLEAQVGSKLPESANGKFIRKFIYKHHLKQISKEEGLVWTPHHES
jgi:hypothetical protein